MIGGIATANAIPFVPVAQGRPAQGHLGRNLDQHDEVGEQSLAADPVQIKHVLVAQPSRPALVGAARIEEAIADYPLACFQRRPDQALDVVGAGSGEQQGLGAGMPALARRIEQQGANLLRTGRAAGLARDDGLDAAQRQRFGQQARLGGLAHPLAPLERDEFPTGHGRSPTTPLARRSSGPAFPTSAPATRGTRAGSWPGTAISSSATCAPRAIGATSGP